MGDTKQEALRRCTVVPGLHNDTIEDLQQMLHNTNKYVSIFKIALDKMDMQNHKVVIRPDAVPRHEHPGRALQDIRDSPKLFGGVTLLLAGDFRQTLPILTGGTPADELDACLKSSHLWGGSLCFSHGQLYVAASRVGSPRRLYMLAPGGKAKNVVYPPALQ
ncbi:hypothetical protein ACOMHN_022376 [Nucella lapillus]